MKQCTQCGATKELTEFGNYTYKGETRKRAACKSCKNEQQNKRYREAPEVHREYLYQKKYGISIQEYDELLASQNGCCKICGTDTPNGQGRFVIDHNHATGEVRGLLCSTCNTGLGNFFDNPEFLKKAATYLETEGNYG